MAELQLRKRIKLKRKDKKLADEIKQTAKKRIKPREKEKLDPDHLIPTSSTLLNCACSDCPTGGYGIGKIVNLIGDSSSGKSLLALSCFAEMSMDSRFDDYDFLYDDVEAALEFNLDYLFGTDVSDRIDTTVLSDTVQDFYGNITRAIKKGKPFIYILDSLDALTSIEEQDRAETYAEKKEVKGSYKMEKARMLSEILRVTAGDIKKTEALVIIVSQVRDNVGFGFSDKTRSGGRALKFYSCHEMWLSVLGSIKKLKRITGVQTKAKVSKNKLTGKVREIKFPIYYDYGVDDIRANIQFLIDEEVWSQKKQTIEAPEFSLKGTIDKVIYGIESRSLEKELQLLVGETWNNVEEKLRLNRKPKYGKV